MNRRLDRGVYFSVAANAPESTAGAFHDVNLPGGVTVRFLRRRLYQNALDSADRKLQEILGNRKDTETGA
jgi:hypothetical protein